MLDPRNIVGTANQRFRSMNAIPRFAEVSRSEWELYFNVLGTLAVKNSNNGDLISNSFGSLI